MWLERQQPSLWMEGGGSWCLGKIPALLWDNDGGCQSGWGWTQSHTQIHRKGGGDLGVLGQLIYSVHPILILISCPSVSCIKRSQPCASFPWPFFHKAISSPVTTTPYPLLYPPPLYISLFSMPWDAASWPDTSLLSLWTPASPAEVGRKGCFWQGEVPETSDLNQTVHHILFVPLTYSEDVGKQLVQTSQMKRDVV